jgi:ribosome-binding factor A
MKVLEGATGYVRRLLAERLGLRTAPEVRFVFDPSIEYGIRLEELLQSEKERSPAPDDIERVNRVEGEREPESE